MNPLFYHCHFLLGFKGSKVLASVPLYFRIFMKENHSRVSNAVKTLGEFIREARQKKGIDVDELSLKTKIHKTLLVKLENNDLYNLPSKTYVVGFLRSISHVLDIPFHESRRLLEQNRSVKKKEKHKMSVSGRLNVLTSHLPLFYKRRELISLKWFLTSLFLLVLILLTIPVFIEKQMAGSIQSGRYIASEPLKKINQDKTKDPVI